MSVIIVTDREFDITPHEALRASAKGPVFITTHGEPTHVVLSAEQYQALTGKPIPRPEEMDI